MLDSYHEPDEFLFLVEQTDFQGNNCLWYLDEYDLYKILDHKIVDNIMNELWQGQKTDVNATIMDYSTAYNLFVDRHNIYTNSDNLFEEYKHRAFDDKKNNELTHRFKYFVWKNSI